MGGGRPRLQTLKLSYRVLKAQNFQREQSNIFGNTFSWSVHFCCARHKIETGGTDITSLFYFGNFRLSAQQKTKANHYFSFDSHFIKIL